MEKMKGIEITNHIVKTFGFDNLRAKGITGFCPLKDSAEVTVLGSVFVVKHLEGVEDYPASYFVEEKVGEGMMRSTQLTQWFSDRLNGKPEH